MPVSRGCQGANPLSVRGTWHLFGETQQPSPSLRPATRSATRRTVPSFGCLPTARHRSASLRGPRPRASVTSGVSSACAGVAALCSPSPRAARPLRSGPCRFRPPTAASVVAARVRSASCVPVETAAQDLDPGQRGRAGRQRRRPREWPNSRGRRCCPSSRGEWSTASPFSCAKRRTAPSAGPGDRPNRSPPAQVTRERSESSTSIEACSSATSRDSSAPSRRRSKSLPAS